MAQYEQGSKSEDESCGHQNSTYDQGWKQVPQPVCRLQRYADLSGSAESLCWFWQVTRIIGTGKPLNTFKPSLAPQSLLFTIPPIMNERSIFPYSSRQKNLDDSCMSIHGKPCCIIHIGTLQSRDQVRAVDSSQSCVTCHIICFSWTELLVKIT